MSAATRTLHPNRLIEALPRKDLQHFLAGCQQVELTFADILCEPNDPIRHVYFPTDSCISLVNPVDSHASMEVALVGNEGMHGIALVLGVDVSPLHALVQGEGSALRMNVAPFRRELQYSPALHRVLNRYIYVRMSQIAQMAACTRFHVVEERLARWLLMTHDRSHSDELHITQEFLGLMLGVRRVGITKAAGALQTRKLIAYSRGIIKVLDRRGLEAASCGCYRADKTTYDRIMKTSAVSPYCSRAGTPMTCPI
jgi:CRP-like cAMP-binding protein